MPFQIWSEIPIDFILSWTCTALQPETWLKPAAQAAFAAVGARVRMSNLTRGARNERE